MMFLQPWLLWLLPLAALPVIIHLLNRMRYRTVEWAASRFLNSARRASTRHAQVRQWLLLACRVLALAALILAVARPLAGGWAGWALSPAPDAVLILLDRSPGMEARDERTGMTFREEALEQAAQGAAALGGRSRCVLIESVFQQPEELAQPALLPRLPEVAATDAAADLPGMFDAAVTWLERNRPGAAEIWIASDLQRSNWQPESSRWRGIASRAAALPQRVRVRLLAPDGEWTPNASVTLVSAVREAHSSAPALNLTFDIRRGDIAPATVPISLWVDGVRSHLDVPVAGAVTRVHHAAPLPPGRESGWGRVELPPDGNGRDNTAWFVYAAPPPVRIGVVCADDAVRQTLLAAADPFPGDSSFSCEAINLGTGAIDWGRYATVLWANPLPVGDAERGLEAFARAGGTAVFFPTGKTDPGAFLAGRWGEPISAGAGNGLRVTHWDEKEGPLADAGSGTPLAVAGLQILRAEPILSGGETRAALGNGEALLTERMAGSGRIYFCGTLPRADWSTLGDGGVLVPMLQRVIAAGAERSVSGLFFEAGDATLREDAAAWSSVETTARRDVRTEAGIYRNGSRLIAVNRPAEEDEPEALTPATARALLEPLNASLWNEPISATAPQGELWRTALLAMLVFLVVESLLTLPPPRGVEAGAIRAAGGAS
jgi:hypothetical protein